MKRASPTPSKNGVTLIEMLVGLVIVGVILAVAIPSVTGMIERRRIVAAAGEIANIFTFARSEANVVAFKLNIHMEDVPSSIADYGSCIRLSTAQTIDSCRCNVTTACNIGTGKLLREFLLPRSGSVSFASTGTWVTGKEQIVSFVRDTHVTGVENVKVTVTGSRTGAQLRVEYNDAGRVRVCSPKLADSAQGSISGFPVCE